eukprot:COSAG05_NODE_1276_length_5305_cov_7.675759_11_plen_88_part_00
MRTMVCVPHSYTYTKGGCRIGMRGTFDLYAPRADAVAAGERRIRLARLQAHSAVVPPTKDIQHLHNSNQIQYHRVCMTYSSSRRARV